MPKDFDYYKKRKERMLENDFDRDIAFEKYEDMVHSHWSLPVELEALDWIRKVVSTDPYDAVAAGVRVLSATEPEIKIQPLAGNTATKKQANMWERNLSWQLESADRRRQAGVVADYVRSSLVYDEIDAHITDLEYQIEQMDLFGGNTKRLEAALRYGRFTVNSYNPKAVHVRYSGIMPEAVLLAVRKSAASVMDEWGSLASELEDYVDNDVLYCDYMDYDDRCIWVEPIEGGGEFRILEPTKHDLPFLPWVTMIGVTSLEDNPLYSRQPILFSVMTSGAWETQNVVKTLYTSEVIVHAAAPRGKEEGPNPSTTEIGYGEPTQIAKVPTGNVYTPLPPPPIDQALAEIDSRFQDSIGKSTVSKILMNADIPSGTAFASLNLATQTAVGALKPSKQLAEKALAETFTLMLLWADFTKKPIIGFGREKRVDEGTQYVIDPKTIAPDAIYIKVNLKPDVPTDRQQRVNTAAMAVQALNYPREYALEDIGVTDPQEAESVRAQELLQDAYLQMSIQQAQQRQALAMQQEAQMQQMLLQLLAQQAQGQQPGGQMGVPSAPAGAVPMAPGQQGPPPGPGPEQGFNPALAGQPAQMAEPALTREFVRGRTRTGEEVAEV